jgi:hypothetical protein
MKIRIVRVTPIDASGRMEIGFDLMNDNGTVVYPNLNVSGRPDEIRPHAVALARSLRDEVIKSKQIKVGDEVDI